MILERRMDINIERMVSDMKDSLGSEMLTDEMIQMIEGLAVLLNRYNAAIRAVSTKLEILDDELRYKGHSNVADELKVQLRDCAETIFATDLRMQEIYNRLNTRAALS